MATFALYIQKEVTYFGEKRPFGNTYHFTTDLGEPFDDALAAQQVKDAEKAITKNEVDFIAWRTWGPTDGSVQANVMRDAGVFEDSGSATGMDQMYKEACLLCVWPLPRSPVENRRRWLRKFLRLAAPTGTAPSTNQYTGGVALSQAMRDEVKTKYIDPVTDLSFFGNFRLSTADGTLPTGDGLVRPYYYTRQIGQ